MDDPESGSEAEEGGGSDKESPSGSWQGATLMGNDLMRTLADTEAANELGIMRLEVQRLKGKVARMEREKDDMVDNFRTTTQILLNRIKELEAEVLQGQSRPSTAAVVERIEGHPRLLTAQLTRPELRGVAGRQEVPEVMRIEEESPEVTGGNSSQTADASICGNCGRQIPEGNMVSHTIHCYRNNFRCDTCDEVLPLRDRESHMQHWRDPMRLLDAASARDLEQVRNMLAHGANLASCVHPDTGDTALHVAARLSDLDLVEVCMGHGVEVDPANAQGEMPLHLAAEAELPVVRLLVELGARLNEADGQGEVPLIRACRRGNAQVARYLVEMRADTDLTTPLGDTPVQIAQRLGHRETVMALCLQGAPLRSGTPKRRSSSGSRGRRGHGERSSSRSRREEGPAEDPPEDGLSGLSGGYPSVGSGPPLPPGSGRPPRHGTSPAGRVR